LRCGDFKECAGCAGGCSFHANFLPQAPRNVQRTLVALLVGLCAPLCATRVCLFRSCLSERTPVEAANPSIAWRRSVAQPGSAPDLGTVVPDENSGAFSTTSHASTHVPWYIPWDFLSARLHWRA
jgi:hypothetical protein